MASHPDEAASAHDRQFVTALARGLQLLACFRQKDGLLGNQELARRCGLAKPTVSRLTHTLTELGYLTRVQESGKYDLGISALSLASVTLGRLDIRRRARPQMQALADSSGCLISLAVRDRLSMVYVDVARSPAAAPFGLDTGSRIQIASSAAGRAYLAAVSEDERNEVMGCVREVADPCRWRVLESGLGKALRDLRSIGLCRSIGEWRTDINAIAVPVRLGRHFAPVAISCGAPAAIASEDFLLEEVGPTLRAVAAHLEKSLGTRSQVGRGRRR